VGAWDRARLREASDAVAERVRRHARGLVAPPSAFALVGDGRIRATSDGHGAWFSARCRAVVEAATREGAERVVIGGCVGRPSRVSGPRGEAVLWRFEAVPAPRRDPAEVLSPRQLAVAGYAAVGATAEEIGRAVGISAHTARQHLKAAYRQLGVRNRVELAHALDAAELSR
jgi:DNA-binding CsgD family transcriptional regulator